ncbi:PilZ domain-containing protein [bacterium]|nr:PilZ domain-containing protein [bacterium]
MGRNIFQTKLSLFITGFFAAGLLVVFGINMLVEKSLINRYTSNITDVGRFFSTNVANSITVQDEYSLRMFARDMSSGDGVLYCIIYDDKDKILAQSASSLKKEPVVPGDEELKIPIVIMGEKFGKIVIGYSLKKEKKRIAEIKKYIISGYLISASILWAYLIFFPNTLTLFMSKLSGSQDAGLEKRNYFRVAVELSAEISTSDKECISGQIKDISLGGISLNCAKELPSSAVYDISFDWKGEKFNLKSEVVRRTPPDKPSNYGIIFTEMNIWDRNKLSALLNKKSK